MPERIVTVHLFHHDGTPCPLSAQVRLESDSGKPTRLKRKGPGNVWTATVPEGTYRLSASGGKLAAPRRRVVVSAEGLDESLHLGEPHWPFYRLGQSAIPFPPDNTLAVVPESGDAGRVSAALGRAMTRLSLAPRAPAAASGAITRPGAIRLLAPSHDAVSASDLRAELEADLGSLAQVGVAVDTRPGRVKVIGREFVVRFREGVSRSEAESYWRAAGAALVRPMAQAPNTYLIRFESGGLREHLAALEEWHERELLVYGEPDLIAEVTDDAFPERIPDDPTWSNQLNLTLQRVDQAWKRLADIDPKLASGHPRVHVATLDRGIDLDHPDLGGVLTDGTPQLARSFDFDGMRECTVAGYAPDTSHGMGVYGIIAAAVDNAEDIAGIASNTHHIGIERPSLTSSRYADVLLWAAGFETGNSTAGWPAEPLRPGADIISCSHGSDGLALSGTMDDTLKKLAREGRAGLGTIVIYSAGNSNDLITGFRTWAAHPTTIAVANSAQPDAGGIERKVASSNFGPEIDVCAQGDDAPSLNDAGGEQVFGGTSAAAPTVAGVAALLLSVNPTLSARQIRQILRETAVRIDPDNTDPVGRWVNGFSRWYGHGRIDAAAAVERATPERGDVSVDLDGDSVAEIPISSPWGIGILERTRSGLTSLAMAANGTRIGGWLLNTRDNRFDVMADLDADGSAELLVTSPWGVGVLQRAGSGYGAVMLEPNGTRFGGWLLNTNDNLFGPAGRFHGGPRSELLVTSPWGIGILRLQGATFANPLIQRNGTRFDGWLLNTVDNRFGPVGDFDGDGKQELLVTSPWGIGLLAAHGGTFDARVIRPNGTRFDGWLLNTRDNRFGPVGDFDGDGKDEVLVRSPWGIGLLALEGDTFRAKVIRPNGTRFGGWLLNTNDNRFHAAADFEGAGRDSLFVSSPWGIGLWALQGDSFTSLAMAPNGSRFDGWLLSTGDNHFQGFSDVTGEGRADVVVTSPWGIGILSRSGASFSCAYLAPNGTRFGGWLLNTENDRLY